MLAEYNSKALHLLRHISYYRLSGYWHPLPHQPKHLHRFKPNASFNNAFKLYCFDRELRQLVLGEVAELTHTEESSVRELLEYAQKEIVKLKTRTV